MAPAKPQPGPKSGHKEKRMKADPYYVAEALVYLSGAIAALEQPVVGTVDVKAAAHWCRQTANMLDSMAYDMDKSAEAEEAARIAEDC